MCYKADCVNESKFPNKNCLLCAKIITIIRLKFEEIESHFWQNHYLNSFFMIELWKISLWTLSTHARNYSPNLWQMVIVMIETRWRSITQTPFWHLYLIDAKNNMYTFLDGALQIACLKQKTFLKRQLDPELVLYNSNFLLIKYQSLNLSKNMM